MEKNQCVPSIQVKEISFEPSIPGIKRGEAKIYGFVAKGFFDCDGEMSYRANFDRLIISGVDITPLVNLNLPDFLSGGFDIRDHFDSLISDRSYLFKNPNCSKDAEFTSEILSKGTYASYRGKKHHVNIIYEEVLVTGSEIHKFYSIHDILIDEISLISTLIPAAWYDLLNFADDIVVSDFSWGMVLRKIEEMGYCQAKVLIDKTDSHAQK